MKYFVSAAALTLFFSMARADHDTKAAIDRGTYAETASVAGSSTTGTAFLAGDNAKRMDAIVFNNTSSVVWIGTTSATAQTNHENTRIGLPVLSSATLSIGGVFSSALYFTCDGGVSACQVRVLEGKNR